MEALSKAQRKLGLEKKIAPEFKEFISSVSEKHGFKEGTFSRTLESYFPQGGEGEVAYVLRSQYKSKTAPEEAYLEAGVYSPEKGIFSSKKVRVGPRRRYKIKEFKEFERPKVKGMSVTEKGYAVQIKTTPMKFSPSEYTIYCR